MSLIEIIDINQNERGIKVKIYFIRHGKTEWNLESRYQGAGGDSELLPESYQQMNQLGEHLKDIEFSHAYSSPIKRARITANRVLQHSKKRPPLSLWNRLEEFHLGKMEGQKFEDVKKQFPESYDNFRNHPEKYDATEIGGESFSDVIDRMQYAINTIVNANREDSNVVIFSHGAALNALINSLLGVEIKDLRKRGGLANTSTTILETNDNGKTFDLIKWNDTEYLTKEIDQTDVI
ncbi:histidine phosphatase family protein [Apilactobacillus apinorum]|uniref:histidine phosphatase family protein n=1 Tax=Apilactobacillus apinorum TaxID=1218495 RepID=UPI00333F76C6